MQVLISLSAKKTKTELKKEIQLVKRRLFDLNKDLELVRQINKLQQDINIARNANGQNKGYMDQGYGDKEAIKKKIAKRKIEMKKNKEKIKALRSKVRGKTTSRQTLEKSIASSRSKLGKLIIRLRKLESK